MILELQIGESIAVRFDDDINDERPTPEVVEDYLTRMRRTAVDPYWLPSRRQPCSRSAPRCEPGADRHTFPMSSTQRHAAHKTSANRTKTGTDRTPVNHSSHTREAHPL